MIEGGGDLTYTTVNVGRWLGAGVFDVGDDGVTMQPFVSVEGSGRRATVITGPGQTGLGGNQQGTVVMADSMILSDVQVRSTGGTGTYAAAIQGMGLGWLVRDVRVEVTVNDASFASGISAASASGSFDFGGTIDNAEIEIFAGSSGGFDVNGIGSDSFSGDTTTFVVRNSTITLHTNGSGVGDIAADSIDGVLEVHNTRIQLLAGGLGAGQSGPDVQRYVNVDMVVEGGSTTNVGFSGAGSGFRPEIIDSRIDISGGSASYGISTNTGRVDVRNSLLQAGTVGMRSTGTGSSFGATYNFYNSTIDASTGFLINTSGTGTFRFQMANSVLDASTNVDVTNTGGGTVETNCVNSNDENFTALNTDCS